MCFQCSTDESSSRETRMAFCGERGLCSAYAKPMASLPLSHSLSTADTISAFNCKNVLEIRIIHKLQRNKLET